MSRDTTAEEPTPRSTRSRTTPAPEDRGDQRGRGLARGYRRLRSGQQAVGVAADALRGDLDSLRQRAADGIQDAAVRNGARAVGRTARSAARRAGQRTREATRDLRHAGSMREGAAALGAVIKHGVRAGALHTAALAVRATPQVVIGARIVGRAGRDVGAAIRDGVLAAGDAMASRATARTAPRPARARSADAPIRGRG